MSGGETFRNPVCTKQCSVKSHFVQSVSLNKAFQNRVCPIYRVHFIFQKILRLLILTDTHFPLFFCPVSPPFFGIFQKTGHTGIANTKKLLDQAVFPCWSNYHTLEGEVIFKKYSPISELGSIAAQYCEALYRTAGFPVLITDRDHVLAVSGISRREALERRVSHGTGSRCSLLRVSPIMRWCSPPSSPPVMYTAA